MIAVCSGGNNLAAWLIVLIALLMWVSVTVLVIRAARDRRERQLLLGLLLGSILLGPLIVYAFFGGGSSVGELALMLLLPGAIGAAIAYKTRAAHGARAFFISTWGTLLLSGAYAIIFIAFIAVGTGCIDD